MQLEPDRASIEAVARGLAQLPDEAVRRSPRPGAWSAKQVLGHLIDSAANNHQRFVRAPDLTHLEFDGYDQDAWVERNGYQQLDWRVLVALWEAYNLLLLEVVARTPVEVLDRACSRHNLDRIAWRPVSSDEPASLRQLVDDYYAHLRHHLEQIERAVAGDSSG